MSSGYEMRKSITRVCGACGKECEILIMGEYDYDAIADYEIDISCRGCRTLLRRTFRGDTYHPDTSGCPDCDGGYYSASKKQWELECERSLAMWDRIFIPANEEGEKK